MAAEFQCDNNKFIDKQPGIISIIKKALKTTEEPVKRIFGYNCTLDGYS